MGGIGLDGFVSGIGRLLVAPREPTTAVSSRWSVLERVFWRGGPSFSEAGFDRDGPILLNFVAAPLALRRRGVLVATWRTTVFGVPLMVRLERSKGPALIPPADANTRSPGSR